MAASRGIDRRDGEPGVEREEELGVWVGSLEQDFSLVLAAQVRDLEDVVEFLAQRQVRYLLHQELLSADATHVFSFVEALRSDGDRKPVGGDASHLALDSVLAGVRHIEGTTRNAAVLGLVNGDDHGTDLDAERRRGKGGLAI